MSDKPRWEIIHGDSLTVLESFPPSTFDAVITDPPYASGGRTQASNVSRVAGDFRLYQYHMHHFKRPPSQSVPLMATICFICSCRFRIFSA